MRSRSFLDLLGSKGRLSKTKSGLVEEELALADADDEQTAKQAYRKFLEKVRERSPEQASLMSVEPLTLQQVQALLEPQQALIEYLVTSQKIYLWMLDKQQVHAFAIPVPKERCRRQSPSFADFDF